MKEKIKIRIFLFLFIVLSFSVKADIKVSAAGGEERGFMDEQDVLATSDDYEGVYGLERELLNDMKRFCLSRELSECPEKVDYQRAVKVYTGADLIRLGSNDREEMLQKLESSAYVWVIPLKTTAGNYQITVARKLSLSEGEKERQDAEGEWMIKSHSLEAVEPYLDQVEKRASELPGCTRIVFVEEQTGFSLPVAIGFDDLKAKYLAGLGFQYEAAFENTSNTSVYEYSEIADRAKEMYVTDSTETQWGPLSSGSNKLLPASKRQETGVLEDDAEKQIEPVQWWKFIVPLLAAVVLAGIAVLRKRKTH